MRIFLGAGFQPAEHLLEVARAADGHGFDGLALPDHLASPAVVDTDYPGTADGSVPWKIDVTPWPEPLVALSAVAACTRLELMTHVYILPLHHPLFVAKSVGTLGSLFPGRFHFGVGVGWMAEEFALVGEEFRTRGRRTDEAIEILRTVWTRKPASYNGRRYAFDPIDMAPTPPVPPSILVGGHSDAAYARAARLGDGYIAMPATLAQYRDEILPRVRAALAEHGRSLEGFHVNAILSEPADVAALAELAALGVASVQVHPFDRQAAMEAPLDEKVAAIGAFARDVLEPFRAQV
ncbi:TIGR03619 family F420-dependent LLM class oxidoreductase [Microbacterium sp. No. 7]|uniref:TIGR03619 family F420-dependent LLM class oxidoreductase n=1 Tax=Microbacterium sp. No. 7 TaxID=1714373 RepID=UPI000B2FCE2D|nr:TIGR03619 family F420-dependent LLM class oxidoreductase [Microbacterium sp. No. 7]